jgi:hypothetical protein
MVGGHSAQLAPGNRFIRNSVILLAFLPAPHWTQDSKAYRLDSVSIRFWQRYP